MRAFAQALRRDQGADVPVPWPSLAKVIRPERGNIGVILARPGVGKSAIALNWMVRSDEPCTILSLDTDLRTQGVRAAAMLSGTAADEVRKEPQRWAAYLEQHTAKVRAYDLSMGVAELGELIAAETQFWGQPPAIVVVDNLADIVTETSFEAVTTVLNKLKRVAREHRTFILILHHSKRSVQRDPLGIHSGEYGGEKQTQIMLSLWSPQGQDGVLRVSVLKNRTGRADPTGNMWVALNFDANTLRIEERSQAERYLDALSGSKPQPVTARGPGANLGGP